MPSRAENAVLAKVELVEPLGSETLLNLRLDGQSLVVMVGLDYKPTVG